LRTILLSLAVLTLFACADPLAGVDRLSDVDLVDDTSVAAIPEPQEQEAAGFLGRILGTATATSLTDVTYGTQLPFGQVGRVCDAKGRNLGKAVGDIDAPGYKIFDSAPDVVSKRTFYLTGFSDGCPRQFTAATALPAAPSRYEEFRYGPAGANLPYGATDKAYDKLKRSECGVGKRKPCGSKLDRSTFFVSAYEFYGNNARWASILIHNGAVLETAIKNN